ncbi:MAG TPA: sigma factor [Acidimicrobiales bacterium]|nr:sigma factor [Acidimicrobiales bacterium]
MLQEAAARFAATASADPAARRKPPFEEAWALAQYQVRRACGRRVWDSSDADDVFARVAFRAWRGYPSFRGDSSFLSWVLRIVEREGDRFLGQRARRAQHVLPMPDSTLETVEAAPEEDHAIAGQHPPAIAMALGEAVRAKLISPAEAAVVAARLAHPGATWAQLAPPLGLSATACAVAHCRAVPKLRVFMFRYRPELFGGARAIAGAFERLQCSDQPLPPAEAEAFRFVVLGHDDSYCRRGWEGALRNACDRVIRLLERQS